MGSDMAMERIHVERYARWEMVGDEQLLSIYRRSSYDYREELMWQGEVNEHTQSLIKVLVAIIPERPEPVLPPKTRLVNVLRDWGLCDGRGEPHDDSVLMDIADEILEEMGFEF